ncbi:MAG: hypothetical protein JNL11_01120 [Bdellovibrionaceae bacterium]|nr:hypothetical protein [Pseudobdellovibrionaceae bacterium]
METKKFIFFCGLTLVFIGCSTGNCRSQKIKSEQAGGPVTPKENKLLQDPSAADRVRVFKPNGSLQCGQGKSIDVATMSKDLKDIHIYKSSVENDGKIRIQMCGVPTGNVNVYEIDKTSLESALSFGFTEWIR